MSCRNIYQLENSIEHNIEGGVNSAVVIVHESERNAEYEWEFESDVKHLIINENEVVGDGLNRELRSFTYDHNYNSSTIVTNTLQRKSMYVPSKHRVQYLPAMENIDETQ